MNMNRRKRLILTTIAISLLAGTAYAAMTTYMSTTNTFTVGQAMNVSALLIGYNQDFAIPGVYVTCTAGTAPTWSCPNPPGTSTIFAGDSIDYLLCVETDKAGVTPSVAVNTGTYTITTTEHWWTLGTSCNNTPTGGADGLPAMTPGTFYRIVIDEALPPGIPSGSLTLATSFGI